MFNHIAFVLFVIAAFDLTSPGACQRSIISTQKYYTEIENSTARLFGKFPSGNIFREEYLEVSFVLIEELSENVAQKNASIVTASFPSNLSLYSYSSNAMNYVIEGDPAILVRQIKQSLHVGNSGTVVVDISEYNDTATIPLGPINVTTLPGAMKMGFSCSNWTFQPNSVAWRFWLEIRIITADPLGITRYESWDPDRQATKFELGTEKINLTIWLQTWSVLDDQFFTQIGLPYEIGLANPGPGLAFRQAWQYPSFETLVYDPDFSILVTIAEPSPVAQDTPSSVINSIATIDASIPTWVPIVIVIAVLVLVLCAVIAVVILKRKKEKEASKTLSSLNQRWAKDANGASTPRPQSPAGLPSTSRPVKSGEWKPAEIKTATLRNAKDLQ